MALVSIIIVIALFVFVAVLVVGEASRPGARPTMGDIRDVLADGELPVFPMAIVLTLTLPHILSLWLTDIDTSALGYMFAFGLSFTAAGIYRECTDGDTGCLYLLAGGGMLVISLFFVIPYAIWLANR